MLPAWLASSRQVPSAVKRTVPDLRVHPVEPDCSEMTGVRPEVALAAGR